MANIINSHHLPIKLDEKFVLLLTNALFPDADALAISVVVQILLKYEKDVEKKNHCLQIMASIDKAKKTDVKKAGEYFRTLLNI